MAVKNSVLNRAWNHLKAKWPRYILYVTSLVLFLALWAVLSWALEDRGSTLAPFVPGPRAVAKAFVDSFVSPVPGFGFGSTLRMGDLVLSSFVRVVLGFAVALAIALPAGLLMGSYWPAESMGRPIVEIFRPIPPLAWVPIFLLAFKSFWGPIAIVFLGAFFPILLNVIFGVRNIDPTLIDAARTLGAKRRQIFFKVTIPSTVPYLMTGIKVGLGVAWMCIVAAEMTGLKGGSGVGYYIWLSSDGIGRYEFTYATMVVIGILSILTAGAAGVFEQRLSKWMKMK